MEETLLRPRAAKYTNAANNNSDATTSSPTTKLTLQTDTEKAAEALSRGKDFLDMSLEHHFQDPVGYPWEVNVYEVLDLIGGHSAVGNLLMRLLGLLALDRDAQDTICAEARAALEATEHSEISCLEHKALMPYTEAAILETLRLASSPIVPHVATKATTLQGYDIDEVRAE